MYKNFLFTFFLCTAMVLHAQENTYEYLLNVGVDFNQADLIPDSVIQNHDIFLIGETHGFHDNYRIAWKMIQEFKRKTNFRYMLAEMDWASSQKLNQALLQQDTIALREYMKKSKGTPAWCQERYELYKNIMRLNQESEIKIQYIGVDVPSGGIRLSLERIQSIRNTYKTSTDTLDAILNQTKLNDSVIGLIGRMKHHVIDNYTEQDFFEHNYHIQNILGYWEAANTSTQNDWDRVRDSCQYENYKLLEKYYDLENEKMLGVWGYIHTFQKESERIKWFSSRMKKGLNKRIYSYRIFYFNSQCMLPASWVPGVIKFYRSPKKLYYSMDVQNDDHWATGKKDGAKYLKKVTDKNTITVFDINRPQSPYKEQRLLLFNYGTNWVTTQYFQSVIVVQNSKATRPLGVNKK